MQYSIQNNQPSMSRRASKLAWRIVAIICVIAVYVLIAHPDYVVGGLPPKHSHNDIMVVSDKYDGDCTGHETAGRCADKCSGPGEFQRGIDKETGAAVCGRVTGCPYGDSVPLGPECDKLAPQQQLQPVQPIEAPALQEFQGK